MKNMKRSALQSYSNTAQHCLFWNIFNSLKKRLRLQWTTGEICVCSQNVSDQESPSSRERWLSAKAYSQAENKSLVLPGSKESLWVQIPCRKKEESTVQDQYNKSANQEDERSWNILREIASRQNEVIKGAFTRTERNRQLNQHGLIKT